MPERIDGRRFSLRQKRFLHGLKRYLCNTRVVGMGAVVGADTPVGARFLRGSMDPKRIKAGKWASPSDTAEMICSRFSRPS